MNSLEFIRKKISKKIKTINEKRNFMINCKKMNIPFNPEITYEDEKELEYLRQIESELEAWEMMKSKFEIKRGEIFDHILRFKQGNGALTNDEYKKLKNFIRVGDK